LTSRVRVLMLSVCVIALFASLAGSAAAINLRVTPDSTWQANGRVLVVMRVKNTVYIGGDFTGVMAPKSSTVVSRNHLAAFSAITGAVLPWNPSPNARVRALSATPDSKTIFAGGDFTSVHGKAHNHVVKLPAGGTGVPGAWPGGANDIVRAVKVYTTKVFIGGDFTSAGGHPRSRLAALGVTSGALQPWAPRANGSVRAFRLSPAGARLFVGGDFTTINGKAAAHLAPVLTTTGALGAWASHPAGDVNVINVSTERVFEGDSGGGGHVRAYNVVSGRLLWTNTTDGNVEGLAMIGNDIIAGGHFNKMGRYQRRHLGAIVKKTGMVDPTWNPSANSALGVFSAAPFGNLLYVGGDFTEWQPGNVKQAHFARFSMR
jgi:hypothetical protein